MKGINRVMTGTTSDMDGIKKLVKETDQKVHGHHF